MLYPVKIEFKDYPSGSWQDWSEYLSEPPRISKKVESENEGEAGLIVFDDAEVSFRYESGSPVYNAFSIDLTSKQRYLFRISAPKTDKTFVQLFEGIADFSTLNWSEFNNVISFSLVDKLSALNLLQGEITRVLDTLNARVLAQYPDADGLEFRVDNNYLNEIWIKPAFGDTSSYTLNSFATPILFAGEILRDPIAMYLTIPSSLTYGLVTESWIEGGWNKIKYIKVDGFQYSAWYDETTYHRFPIWFSPNYIAEFGGKEIYGIDILNYNAGVPESINGFSLIEVLISKAWPGINFIYRGISAYNIPLNYYILFLDENPLGKTPLDALKMIADSMKCYIFFDRTGSNLIVQSKSSLATGGTTRSIGSTKIISGPEKKYFWDKLVDGVTVNVKSWAVNDVTGENLVGVAEFTKQPTGFSAIQKIKPKNSIKRELLVGDPAIDTQEELNTYAAQEALSVLNFYGLRHSSFDINLNLDDNTINWELIDSLTISTLTTFFTKMEIDLVTRNISLEAVEITGHDYDFRQLVFGSAESSGSSIISSSSSGGGSYYSGITPIFNPPLQMSGGIVSLLITNNLKLTSDKLDTIQDIAPTSTPTLAQLLLTNQATQTTQAVRGDRIIATSYPLTGGGDLTADRTLGLSYNTTNLKLTSNQLNTIQDIATTSSPTFNQLTLTSAGTTTTSAVRGDRAINVTAPLTGGGNLTSDRTIGLSYNATNLKLTSNALNTIQDIATTSSPTFKLPNFTGGIKINGATLSDASRKLTAADIISDGYIQAKTKFQGDQNNHFATTIKDITVLPGGFLEYYPFNFRFDQNQLLYCNRRPTSDGITIQSSGFADLEIDILFSVYAQYISLHGKPENSFIEVTTSGNILGDAPTYPFVVLHSNNNPVTCKIEVRWSGTGTWNVIYDGTFINFIMPVNPAGSGYVNGVRWTFYNILNPTYIRWLGWYAPRLRAYGWTVMRGGDTMYGNFVLAAPYKLSIGITNPSEALEVSGNIKSTGWLQGTTAKLTNLTDGYIPYHINDTSGLANSPIYTNGTNIGIGATTPTEKLDVSGNIKASGTLQGTTAKLTNLTDGYIPYHINDTSGLTNSIIYTDGSKVRIGGTLTPVEIFNLEGNFRHNGNYSLYNNFTSGWTGSGWRLDYGITATNRSHLELDDLTVRGTMRVYELIINQIRATNGSLFVSSTAKVESISDGIIGDYLITFEDPEGNGYMPFADNDIIMMQRVDLNGTSVVRYLVGRVLSHSSNTIEFLIQDGTDTPQKGDVFVRIGSTSDANRQGTVYLTSDDTASPYIDIYDGVNNYSLFKTSSVRKVRLGKLTGLTDSDFGTLSGYGLYATNAYLKGGIWATFGNIGGWTIDTQKLFNGTDIILDAVNKKVSVNNDAVKMYYTSASDYGIKDSAGRFQLGSTNQIAGWTIDTSQIYNSSVRLESSATLKGLGVKDGVSDVLKVGDFTNASETYATATMPNAPNPASAWTNEINVNNRLTWNSYGSNYGMASSNTDFTSYQWRTYLTLPINDIKGKTITISFGIAERESTNGSSKATNIWAYIKTDVGTFALMDVTPAGGVYLLGNTPTYETRTLTATIPSNATYARFYIAWYKNGAFDPADVLFNNWSFLIYNKTIVELNKTGLKIYNSPISKILLNNNEAVFNLPFVRASSGIQLGERWTLVVEPYLEGDGITLNERLTLKYNGVMKGFFSQTDGTYVHV